LVISQDGSDMTKEVLEEYEKPSSDEYYRKILDEIVFSKNWRIVRKGDWRVTNIKKEVDDVYNNISKVVPKSRPVVSEETDFTEEMIKDTQGLYDSGDYNKIEEYIRSNELLILHP